MDFKKYHIGNNNKISELPLYRTLTIFIKELKPKILNLQKDIKITYGYKILTYTIEMIELIRKSYVTPDYAYKLETIRDLTEILAKVELEIKMLYEMGDMSLNQIALLSRYMGNMVEQLNKWKTYIEKKQNEK